MTSGYVGIVDGPWACYVCAVFGDTAEGWWRHGREKHPIKLMPFQVPPRGLRPLLTRVIQSLDARRDECITTWAAVLAEDVALAGD